jgi:hypothetical protein
LCILTWVAIQKEVPPLTPFVYPALKFLAYSAWCYFGLRIYRPQQPDRLTRWLVYGFLRTLMGVFFGIFIYLASSLILQKIGIGLPQNVLTYLSVYVPVRWVEWSIMAALIIPDPFTFGYWLRGSSQRDRLWRLGGIVISCLADIPLIISLGGIIPTGRFLC